MNPMPFLTAEWRSLLMLNFDVPADVLRPYLPRGTEIDFWNGRTFVSIVGFRFLQTKVLGLRIPFHRQFDEINLRFYVRRKTDDGWRRGVVFIKEIVPRRMVSFVARNVYGENYVTRRMRSEIVLPNGLDTGCVKYGWQHDRRWNWLTADIAGAPAEMGAETEESFITEHYWGYARQRDGGTIEYEVTHPRWCVWRATDWEFTGDGKLEYPAEFQTCLSGAPSSVFVADGSAVEVWNGRRLL